MKLGFTTLGCPDWDLDTICKKGRAFGYDGVDFRGLQEEIDVTVLPAFTTGIADTERKFADAGLRVCGISSSIGVCEAENLESNLEEARRTIPVAAALGVETIRVFGRGSAETQSREALADAGKRTMEAILELDGASDFKWMFETHDLWISARDCRLLLDGIPNKAFGALWDIGHTSRVGRETPAESYRALEGRIYGVHIKDAVYDTMHPEAMKDGWRYVTPGTGELPLAEAVGLLEHGGFDGWVIFEHEKRWHRELPDPEEIFPECVAWFRSL